MSKNSGLEALKSYNDWCEKADNFISQVASTTNSQSDSVPRSLADSTITALATEVMQLQQAMHQLLKEEALPTKLSALKDIEKLYARKPINEF